MIFDSRIVMETEHRRVYCFKNNYGADVHKEDGEEFWNLAVIRWNSGWDFYYDYHTSVGACVLTELTDEEVENLLCDISEL